MSVHGYARHGSQPHSSYSARHTVAAPHSAVAELGVVRRFLHIMPFPLKAHGTVTMPVPNREAAESVTVSVYRAVRADMNISDVSGDSRHLYFRTSLLHGDRSSPLVIVDSGELRSLSSDSHVSFHFRLVLVRNLFFSLPFAGLLLFVLASTSGSLGPVALLSAFALWSGLVCAGYFLTPRRFSRFLQRSALLALDTYSRRHEPNVA
jgi:hypothetical protein